MAVVGRKLTKVYSCEIFSLVADLKTYLRNRADRFPLIRRNFVAESRLAQKSPLIPIMSMTRVGIAVFVCLAVSSTLASILQPAGESKISKVYDVERGSSNDSVVDPDKSDRSLDRNETFLAGEDTPVWIAHFPDPNNKTVLHYEKLEKGIVKKAIDYWRSNGLDEFFDYEARHPKADLLSRIRSSAKKINGTVYRPSVLAVMEYQEAWPSDKELQRDFIMKRIIYALAYWNGVDIQLRAIENPWIRLRLAGIVIDRNIDETYHLYEMRNRARYLHLRGTLYRTADYWDRMHKNSDFQRGTFNIVALMTSVAGNPDFESTVGSWFPNGVLCDHGNPDAMGVLVTSDQMDFSGLQQVVGKVAHMLGHGSDENPACTYRSDWNSREWNKCDLDSIRKSLLSNGWCMKGLTSVHDPGKPVETILPGMVKSLHNQCAINHSSSRFSCAFWTCKEVYCLIDIIIECKQFNPALDGTECGHGKTCLNAKCVNDKMLSPL